MSRRSKCRKTSTVVSTRGDADSPSKAGAQVCGLCNKVPDTQSFGRFFTDKSATLSLHQYCMFFASGLAQNGLDHQGFDGFLLPDIIEEIGRAKRLKCSICRRLGASIGCCMAKCSRKYHYQCGKKHGALFQFFGSFKTYCQDHRPHQRLHAANRFGNRSLPVMCPICLCNVTPDTGMNTLRTPCCKNSWFHRDCIQRQASSSGMYYFRCSVCNNKDKFQNEMHVMGIFIPEQDAIWEDGDAYADLLFSYNRCDSSHCICKKGRTFSTKHGPWRLRLCDGCGQCGTHVKCQRWKKIPEEWMCEICGGSASDVTSDAGSAAPSHQEDLQRVVTEDSEMDVDVCGEELGTVFDDQTKSSPQRTTHRTTRSARKTSTKRSPQSTTHSAPKRTTQRAPKRSPQRESGGASSLQGQSDCGTECSGKSCEVSPTRKQHLNFTSWQLQSVAGSLENVRNSPGSNVMNGAVNERRQDDGIPEPWSLGRKPVSSDNGSSGCFSETTFPRRVYKRPRLLERSVEPETIIIIKDSDSESSSSSDDEERDVCCLAKAVGIPSDLFGEPALINAVVQTCCRMKQKKRKIQTSPEDI